jgi:Domain of unknown function (DUF4352)
MLTRAPQRVLVGGALLVVALLVYGYFTQPLPFGLSGVVHNPGAGVAATTGGPVATSARAGAGQPLTLGVVSVVVDGVQRNQNLATGQERGPAGAFTVVQLQVQNGGTEPVSLQASDFRLVDDRGRTYAVDVEATRAAAQAARRRYPFEATVPPGGRLPTTLAFEPAADAQNLALRASLGYGELDLPR